MFEIIQRFLLIKKKVFLLRGHSHSQTSWPLFKKKQFYGYCFISLE